MSEDGQAAARLQALIRFASRLEESSPYVTFDELVRRAQESAVLPLRTEQIAALVQAAIQQGIFFTDARMIFDRAAAEFREVTLVRTNHQHPAVQKAVGSGQ